MTPFATFARLVSASFQDIMRKGHVFVSAVGADPDMLWDAYLAAFPEGTNPRFAVRTEHDCGCCKHFVRRAGCVISVSDGKVSTVWDHAAETAPEPYQGIAKVLQGIVRGLCLRLDLFRIGVKETEFGAQHTRSLHKATQKAVTWEHFYTGEIPKKYRCLSPDTEKGNYRTSAQVFERGLIELAPDAVDTVLSLIQDNSLYRGEEHKRAVVEFQKMQRAFLEKSTAESTLFVWEHAGHPAARFRNTVIGTLVQDLSEGKGLERAVESFETKVAPQNYKRTTALITPMMVKKAMQTIESLGLEPALERRFAVMRDVSVNDVLWVDGAARPLMKGGIGDALMKHAEASRPAQKAEERVESVAVADFMKLLPEVQAMEVFFSGKHMGNLMALTAPVHPEPKQLFRWSNDFAWSYGGNVADSIAERVKKAGGKVEGAALRVSLSWFNLDDLDLHVFEPEGRALQGLHGMHIHFRHKRGWTGGELDVDMNAGQGTTREAVENVVWMTKPPDGPYRVVVNNFTLREHAHPGFVVEVESEGKLSHYAFNKGVRDKQDITVATLHVKNGTVERVDVGDPAITASNISREKWGLSTERYVKVNTVMLSPNYWGPNAVGNKHTFLVLEGAKSDEDMRGFYNEFLHPRLEEHRKVFEIIGDKTKCRPTDGHLAGLGFSSTKPDTFRVRIQQGKRQRILDVYVGV